MQIHVLYFAQVKDALGSSGETLTVDAGTCARDIVRALEARPGWSRVRGVPLSFAVNEEVVDGDHALEDGDRLALLPPVSGG